MYDVVIVGGGPAGLSAAMTAKREGLNYILLEKDHILSTFDKYHPDKLVQAYPYDQKVEGPLPFKEMLACDLIAKWRELAKSLEIRIEELVGLEQKDGKYIVKTNKGEYETKTVVIATGIQGSPRRLNVPGEEQENVFHNYMPCVEFKGKTVVVVGGGDVALENALIAESKGAKVIISYRKPSFFRPHEENLKKLAKSKIKVIFNSNVVKIEGNELTLDVKGSQEKIRFDFLLLCLGTVWPEEFLRKIGVKVERRNEFVSEPVEAKPGVYVAGDLVGNPSIKMAINQGFRAVRKIVER